MWRTYLLKNGVSSSARPSRQTKRRCLVSNSTLSKRFRCLKKSKFLSNMTASSLTDRYSLIPKGSAPGVSVGHTCSFIPSEDEGKGRIVIIGGANPSGSFSYSHTINLGKAKTISFPVCKQLYNARLS